MARPNFVFIVTDQQRADYLGCTGHPVLNTPNIDSLAARGTSFSRFHVASPVCMPNRATLMTGLMPSVNGVRQNGNDLPHFIRTFPQVLAASGYDTALLGKSHLQTMTPFPTPIGPNPVGTGSLADAIDIGPAEDYLSEDPKAWAAASTSPVTLPFYGFDRADIVTFHGDGTGGAHLEWLNSQVDDLATLLGPENQLPHDYSCPQAVRTALPEELYSTNYIRDLAVEYLKAPERDSRPFFAFVSFPDPHHPFTPPGRYWEMYAPEDMPGTDGYAAHTNPPPHLKWLADQPFASGAEFQSDAVQIHHRHAQEAQALTCGQITMVDDAVGEILRVLDQRGLGDNTIVAFTSDHGDYLGQHGLMFKGGLHFQSLIRVPMIWADPRVDQPTETGVLGSTLDIAPTILAAAQATPYAGIQGLDLSSVLDGSVSVLARDDLLIEEQTYFENILGFEGQVRVRTLVHDRWRLSVYYGVDWGELYDLDADPHEVNNLWDSDCHKATRQELLWRLVQSQIHYSPQTPWPKQEA